MPPTDRNPSRTRLRHFAWLLAVVLAVLAWRLNPSPASLPLRLAGAGVFAAGTFWPNLFHGLYVLVAALLYPLAWLVGRPDLVTLGPSQTETGRSGTARKRRRRLASTRQRDPANH